MLFVSDSEIQTLLKNYFLLTGIKIGICDCELKYNAVTFDTNFCDRMQSVPEFHEACVNCDQRAMILCRREKKERLYRCHAGFWEYMTPILCEDVVVGYAFTGMITDGSPEEHDLLKYNLMRYGISEEAFEESYSKFPHKPMDQIRAACGIIEACVSCIYYRKMIQLNHSGNVKKISEYIDAHLGEKLTAGVLCSKFEISRSELYKEFNEYYRKGVAEYIRDKRIVVACQMMETSKKRITEIAAAVGYSDYTYFSRVFREKYNMSPREYRHNFQQPNTSPAEPSDYVTKFECK